MSSASWNPLAALSSEKREKLMAFEALLVRFNRKINLISEPSAVHVGEQHLVHCLALAWKAFPAGSRLVDWGTGGGLPAIPLAICFPEVQVRAVDAVGKKVRAVRAMARRLELENLQVWHGRAGAWPGSAHYSVSRATAPLVDLWRWHRRVAEPPPPGAKPGDRTWPPGLLALKGGDFSEEVGMLGEAFPSAVVEQHGLELLLGRSFFAEKYIVAVDETAGEIFSKNP